MVNKKGQEMSVTAIILIVLGIVIAVVVILGFTGGWSNLWEKINIFQPKANLDELVQSCNLAIMQPSAFCEYKFVTLDGQKQYVNCFHPSIKARLEAGAPESCAAPFGLSETGFCAKLKADGKDTTATRVNGQLCS